MEPEREARRRIDAAPTATGWAVQDYRAMNLSEGAGPHRAVADRELPMREYLIRGADRA